MHDPNTWHSMSSRRWLTRSILEDQGVPETASPLPRRVSLKDLHVIHRTVLGVCFHHAYSIHHSYTLAHSAKNGMFAIQPLSGGEGREELAAIGVWPCIGHCKNPSPSELQVWMKFVFKLFPIDGCATAACPIRRQVVSRPVPQSTAQKKPEVKGLFRVQRGMLWTASTPAQPLVDTL